MAKSAKKAGWEKARALGTGLTCTSSPTGALIYLKPPNVPWYFTNRATPETFYTPDVIPGLTYDIKLTYPNYEDCIKTVFYSPGVTCHCNLTPKPRNMAIISVPSGARIFVDGKDTGEVAPATVPMTVNTPHTLVCKKEHFEDCTMDVAAFGPGPTGLIRCYLKPDLDEGADKASIWDQFTGWLDGVGDYLTQLLWEQLAVKVWAKGKDVFFVWLLGIYGLSIVKGNWIANKIGLANIFDKITEFLQEHNYDLTFGILGAIIEETTGKSVIEHLAGKIKDTFGVDVYELVLKHILIPLGDILTSDQAKWFYEAIGIKGLCDEWLKTLTKYFEGYSYAELTTLKNEILTKYNEAVGIREDTGSWPPPDPYAEYFDSKIDYYGVGEEDALLIPKIPKQLMAIMGILGVEIILCWAGEEMTQSASLETFQAIKAEQWDLAEAANMHYYAAILAYLISLIIYTIVIIWKTKVWPVAAIAAYFGVYIVQQFHVQDTYASIIADHREAAKKPPGPQFGGKLGVIKIISDPPLADIHLMWGGEWENMLKTPQSIVLPEGTYDVRLHLVDWKGIEWEKYGTITVVKKGKDTKLIHLEKLGPKIPEHIIAHVSTVTDGDTLALRLEATDAETGETIYLPEHDTTKHASLRLVGINAPEKSPKGDIKCETPGPHEDLKHVASHWADDSRMNLHNLIYGEDVDVYIDPENQYGIYGRLLGKVVYNGENLNKKQLLAGMACFHTYGFENKYVDETTYKIAEAAAWLAKIGIWSLPTGRVHLTSTPTHAYIYIDGEAYDSKYTPETIDMTIGEHSITLKRDDCYDETQSFTIVAGEQDIHMELREKVTCDKATTHFGSGCELLLHYDEDKDGKISLIELRQAAKDVETKIVMDELDFINDCYANYGGSIDAICTGCRPETATYKLLRAYDEAGNELSQVKIYVDGLYTHHWVPEELTFGPMKNCGTAEYFVPCELGTHTIRLVKGEISWEETITLEAGDIIERSPTLAIAICPWIDTMGVHKLTVTHALYVYALSIGATGTADRKYEELVPKPARLPEEYATLEHALGIYAYSQGAYETGNRKSGCDYA